MLLIDSSFIISVRGWVPSSDWYAPDDIVNKDFRYRIDHRSRRPELHETQIESSLECVQLYFHICFKTVYSCSWSIRPSSDVEAVSFVSLPLLPVALPLPLPTF